MLRSRNLVSWMVVASMSWIAAAAQGSLPADRSVQYKIRTNPADPNSAVVWIIQLDLKAQQVRGSYVGWRIDQFTLTQFNSSGQQQAKWAQSQPTLGTIDGLWWVQHSDPLAPTLNEFAMPPGLSGTAAPVSGSTDDMTYRVSGVPYVPPSGGAPYGGHVAALDFEFIIYPDPDPLDSGDDEPVEMGGED